ncbi:MAG: c-type cytochrome biogenesis protein CcmI [Betaproteobacteria bacterium RIFCSPLOWO2_12_FULL_65_110]|nr:MAG: c-type cytochrome biogenesis protein CcmI [Betaproteobacteria bacterium RIFCSPLOWO2_12_FULL_65_110]
MTVFLALAAVMMTGALLVVLPPLLARREAETSDRGAANIELLRRALEDNDAELRAGAIDRGQWESARREIERRAVEESQVTDGERPALAARSPRIALLLAVVLPMAAIAMYIVLGEPRALSGRPPAAQAAAGHAAENEQMLAMADSLAKRLNAAPEDGEGWAMLGRTYAYVGRLQDALNAFEEAIKRRPDDARLLADYADVYAGARGGGSLAGEPEKLLKRALALDPNQPKALALAGTIAFQKKDFATAARDWERALAVLPQDSEFAKQITAGLAEARAALGQTQPKASAARAAPAAAATDAGRAVSGTVTITPELAGRASPNDTLFIFARAPQGGGPPLAVFRATVRELPLKFTLDDSMAMSPDNTLSRATRVVITARVAKSGGVVPQPGDLEGASKPVAPGASGVAVLIDKAR